MLPCLMLILGVATAAEPGAPAWTFRPDPAAHTGEVTALALSPTAAVTASAGADGTLRLWDQSAGAVVVQAAPRGLRELRFTADGTLLVAVTEAGAELLQPGTGDSLGVVASPQPFRHLAVAPDGGRLAWVSRSEVILTDAGGTELWRWTAPTGAAAAGDRLGVAAFDTDSDRLLVVRRVGTGLGSDRLGPTGEVLSLALAASPGAAAGASAGEAATPFPVHDLRSFEAASDRPVDAAAWFDGRADSLVLEQDFLLLGGRSVRIGLEGQASAAVIHQAPPRGRAVADLSLARGRVAGFDLPVPSFWSVDLGTGTKKLGGPEHRLPSPWRAELDLDRDLAVVADRHGALLWFQPSDRAPVAMAAGTLAPVSAVTSSGGTFLLGDAEGRLTWLQPEGHERVRTVETGLEAIHDLAEWNGFVAVAGDRLLVYKVATGELGFSKEARDITAVSWAGDLLLSGHEDGRLRAWRGGKAPVFSVQAHGGPLLDVVVSADGRTVFTLGPDGELAAWSVPAGKERWRQRVAGPARAVDLSPDGGALQALRHGAEGEEVVFLDLSTGAELRTLPAAGAVGFVDGRVLRSVGEGFGLLDLSTSGGGEERGDFQAGPYGVAALAGDWLLLGVEGGLGFALYER